MEPRSVGMRIVQLRFDVHLQRTRKRDDKEVAKRLALLKQNPLLKLITMVACRDEGTRTTSPPRTLCRAFRFHFVRSRG